MVITDQAKQALQDILKNTVKKEFVFILQTTDRLEIINGIRVAMDEKVASIIERVTLDVEETGKGVQFVLLGLNQCC